MDTLNFSFVENNLSNEQKERLLPKRHSELASGFDLVCAQVEKKIIEPKKRALINTGIAIALEPGIEAQIRSRSGLAIKHGIMALNSPGTIDADYRGEIKVILANLGEEPFMIEFGMRIAQMVICPILRPQLKRVNTLSESGRNKGGFGSTGM